MNTMFVATCWCWAIASTASALSTKPSASSSFRTLLSLSSVLLDSQGNHIVKEGSSPGFLKEGKKNLVVVLPQLGEFDSSEYTEFLVAVAKTALPEANIHLSIIGIGEKKAADAFCKFTNLSPECLFLDPQAKVHQALQLHKGPDWDIPHNFSDDTLRWIVNQLPGGASVTDKDLRTVGRAWLNYLAMCAGLGAKGTLREILRGYFGDINAPERFRRDDVVKAGFVTIGPGVGPVKIGPLSYDQWFSDESGYQRPVELATVRLKNMVEVLSKWDTYVSDTSLIDLRGATYLFDENGNELYCYRSRGVLTYSDTMPRPLTYLTPYVGEAIARNPLQLPDNGGGQYKRGRGLLKPAGKFMSLLSILFKIENKLQAQLLGATEEDRANARRIINRDIQNSKVVVYTYRLSPFSIEATALLEELGTSFKKVELGLEWFLLDKDASTIRAELLELTGQSSLPQVFVDGVHIGGLFTGSADGKYPGLAGLRESGRLQELLQD